MNKQFIKNLPFAIALCSVVAIASLATTSTHAAEVRQIGTCSPAAPQPDQGFSVELQSIEGSQLNPRTIVLATVSEETIAGPRLVQAYEVKFVEPAHGILGSRGAYVGKRFYLSFPVVPGTPDGRIYANLVAKTHQGRKVTEQLLCDINF